MAASNARLPAIWMCGCAVFALAGCDKPARDDMSWAQGALERNGRLQILTVDRQAHAFTVRLKDTGELRIVQADEVVGSLPTPAGEANTARAGAIVAAEDARATPAPEAAPPAAEPAAETTAAAAVTAATAAAGPGVIASGPGYSIKSARTDGTTRAGASGFAQNDFIAKGLASSVATNPLFVRERAS